MNNSGNSLGFQITVCRSSRQCKRSGATEEVDEESDYVDEVLVARRSLIDDLLADGWIGKDGHCSSESEDAQIDQVAGEL